MAKHCLTLAELDRERIADIERKLGLKLDGSQLAANTANRTRARRKVARPATFRSTTGRVATHYRTDTTKEQWKGHP